MALMMIVPMWPIRLAVWLILGLSFYWLLITQAWRTASSAIEAVELDTEGSLSVRFTGNEHWHSCQVKSRFVHPWVTLLSLRVVGRSIPIKLVIAADAVEAEAFRRWRVRLKHETAVA